VQQEVQAPAGGEGEGQDSGQGGARGGGGGGGPLHFLIRGATVHLLTPSPVSECNIYIDIDMNVLLVCYITRY